MVRKIFTGSMIHAVENEVIFKKSVTILVENGKIIDVVENPDTLENQQKIKDFRAVLLYVLKPGQFIIPGFIDCHTHAVQFPNLGVGYDKTSLEWLKTYTSSLEEQYTDQKLAPYVFETVVKSSVNAGTIAASYFTSIYNTGNILLINRVLWYGQRAFIGKINMNVRRDNDFYEKTEKSIKSTKKFIQFLKARLNSTENPNSCVKPIISPKCALSCDLNIMKQLANMAKEENLHIQSNISETEDEVRAVKEKFGSRTFTDIYEAAGLLSNKTILAHGNYLSDDELKTLAKRETAIIHCPTSNLNLKSGLCDVRRLKENNIVVGLGTDILGGSSYSFLDEMRSALHVSFTLSLVKQDYVPLNYKDVFIMATLGGAKALSIEDKVGNLIPGKEFDALVIDLDTEESLLDNFREYTLEEKLQKFIYAGDNHNIVTVYLKGEKKKFENYTE